MQETDRLITSKRHKSERKRLELSFIWLHQAPESQGGDGEERQGATFGFGSSGASRESRVAPAVFSEHQMVNWGKAMLKHDLNWSKGQSWVTLSDSSYIENPAVICMPSRLDRHCEPQPVRRASRSAAVG